MKLTQKQFIDRSKLIHGDKYDYSLVNYIRSNLKVKIICVTHNLMFEQSPVLHMTGSQCPSCSKRVNRTTEQFIEEAIVIHGNKFDYSQVIFTTKKSPVKIICNTCNTIFKQAPGNHLIGQGCMNCYNKNTVRSLEQFIQKAKKIHGNKYNYSKVIYKNNDTYVIIICQIHGEFQQSPHSHLNGSNCIKCANNMRSTEEFIKDANKKHNYKYKYENTIFTGVRTKVIVTCLKHGNFKIISGNHLFGQGCKKCNNVGHSKEQIKWLDYVAKRDNIFIQHAMNIGEYKIDNIQVDGFCKETNTCYEFLGDFWHGNPKKFKRNDMNKCNKKTFGYLYDETKKRNKIIIDKGYTLVTIWENDWYEIKKKINSKQV
jgi:hypothetical protein